MKNIVLSEKSTGAKFNIKRGAKNLLNIESAGKFQLLDEDDKTPFVDFKTKVDGDDLVIEMTDDGTILVLKNFAKSDSNGNANYIVMPNIDGDSIGEAPLTAQQISTFEMVAGDYFADPILAATAIEGATVAGAGWISVAMIPFIVGVGGYLAANSEDLVAQNPNDGKFEQALKDVADHIKEKIDGADESDDFKEALMSYLEENESDVEDGEGADEFKEALKKYVESLKDDEDEDDDDNEDKKDPENKDDDKKPTKPEDKKDSESGDGSDKKEEGDSSDSKDKPKDDSGKEEKPDGKTEDKPDDNTNTPPLPPKPEPNNKATVSIKVKGEALEAEVKDADKYDAQEVTYTWSKGGQELASGKGPDFASYKPQKADEKSEIQLKVEFTDKAGHAETAQASHTVPEGFVADTTPPQPPQPPKPEPNNEATVSIKVKGETLEAEVKDADKFDEQEVTYTWSKGGQELTSGKGPDFASYKPQKADEKSEIQLKVEFTDKAGHAETAQASHTVPEGFVADTTPPQPPQPPKPERNNEATVSIKVKGETLEAEVKDTDKYDAQEVTYTWSKGGQELASGKGPDFASYKPQKADEKSEIQLKVEFTDKAGHAETAQASHTVPEGFVTDTTPPQPPQPPKPEPNNEATVSIKVKGETLEAEVKDADKYDAQEVTYTWSKGGQELTSGKGPEFASYKPQKADEKSEIQLKVEFTDKAGHAETAQASHTVPEGFVADTTPPQPPKPEPNNEASVSINEKGESLVAEITDADKYDTQEVTYTWSKGGQELTSGKGPDFASYKPQKADEKSEIQLKVEFTDKAGHAETAQAAHTVPEGFVADTTPPQPPQPPKPEPNNESSVSINEDGESLVAKITDADKYDAQEVTYTWSKGGQELTSGKGPDFASYKPQKADEKSEIQLKVEFTDKAGHAEVAQAAHTVPEGFVADTTPPQPPKPEPNNEASVSINEDGESLVAEITDADKYDEQEVTYTWSKGGQELSSGKGPDFASYKPQKADEKSEIQLKVEFTDKAGHTEVAQASHTVPEGFVADTTPPQPPKPEPNNEASVSINEKGESLVAEITDADKYDTQEVTYTWSKGGQELTSGKGPDFASYKPQKADEKSEIQLKVEFTDNAGHAEVAQAAHTVPEGFVADTTPPQPPKPEPNNESSVSINEDGESLVAAITDADKYDEQEVTYTWSKGGQELSSGKGPEFASYKPQKADEKSEIQLKVEFTDNAGHAETAQAAHTVPEGFVPDATPPQPTQNHPASLQLKKIGSTIISIINDEDQYTQNDVQYTWKKDGQVVKTGVGGQNYFYDISPEDANSVITLEAVFTDNAKNDESVAGSIDAATGKTQDPESPSGNGSVKINAEGGVLSAVLEDADGYNAQEVTYTWSKGGQQLSSGKGAKFASYKPQKADENSQIELTVSYEDDKGNKEEAKAQYDVPSNLTPSLDEPLPYGDGAIRIRSIAGVDARISAKERLNGTEIDGVVRSDLKDSMEIEIGAKKFSGDSIQTFDRGDGYHEWVLKLDTGAIDSLGLAEDKPQLFHVTAGSEKASGTIGLELVPGDYRPLINIKENFDNSEIGEIDLAAFQKAVNEALNGGDSTFTISGKSKLLGDPKNFNLTLLVDGQIVDAQQSGSDWSHTFDADELRNLGINRDLESIAIQAVIRNNDDQVEGYSQTTLQLHQFKELFIDPVSGNNIVVKGNDEYANMSISEHMRNAKGGETILISFTPDHRHPGLGEALPDEVIEAKVNTDGTWSAALGESVAKKLEGLQEGAYRIKASVKGQEEILWNEIVVANSSSPDTNLYTTDNETSFNSALTYVKKLATSIENFDDLPVLKDGADYSKVIPQDDIAHVGYKSNESYLTSANIFRSFNQLEEMVLEDDNSGAYYTQRGGALMAWAQNIGHTTESLGSSVQGAILIQSCRYIGGHDDHEPFFNYMYEVSSPTAGHRFALMYYGANHITTGSYARNDGKSGVYSVNSTPFYDPVYEPIFNEWPAAGYFPLSFLPRWYWSIQLNNNQFSLSENTSVECVITSNKDGFETKTIQCESSNHTLDMVNNGVVFTLDRDLIPSHLEKGEIVNVRVNYRAGDKTVSYDVKLFDDSQYALGDSLGYGSKSANGNEAEGDSANGEAKSHPEAAALLVDGKETTLPDDGLLAFDESSHESTAGASSHVVEAEKLIGARVVMGDSEDLAIVKGDSVGTDFNMGAGDDVVILGRYGGGTVDGGEGNDILAFSGAGNVTWLSNFSNFETIDLGGQKAEGAVTNLLRIDGKSMEANHDANGILKIDGDKGNKVMFTDGEIKNIKHVVDENGDFRVSMEYESQGNSWTILMSESLYNNGSGII